jgi:hypothetical protein
MRKSLGWTPALDWKNLMSIMIEDEIQNRERVIDWDNIMDKNDINIKLLNTIS